MWSDIMMHDRCRGHSDRDREEGTDLLYSMQGRTHHQTVNQLLQERMQSEATQNLPLSETSPRCGHAFRHFSPLNKMRTWTALLCWVWLMFESKHIRSCPACTILHFHAFVDCSTRLPRSTRASRSPSRLMINSDTAKLERSCHSGPLMGTQAGWTDFLPQ